MDAEAQPMNTAPKDGTKIRCWFVPSKVYVDAVWDDGWSAWLIYLPGFDDPLICPDASELRHWPLRGPQREEG